MMMDGNKYLSELGLCNSRRETIVNALMPFSIGRFTVVIDLVQKLCWVCMRRVCRTNKQPMNFI